MFSGTISGSSTVNQSISDGGDGTYGAWEFTTIDISGAPAGAQITDVDVTYKIQHAYAGDLQVDLDVQSSSAAYRLRDREGGALDNPSDTVTGIDAFDGLSPNRTWYLYARDGQALDAGYIDEWSITLHYDEPATAPDTPAVYDPGSSTAPGPTISDLTPDFDWSSETGATHYGLYISKAPYGASNIVYENENIASSSFTLPSSQSLEPGEQYRWNVRAFNGSHASSYSDRLYFQTQAGAPDIPTPSDPGSTTAPGPVVSDLTPFFDWSSESGATRYGLYISEAPYGASNLVYENENITNSNFTLPSSQALDPGKQYRWNVQAINGSQGSGTSDRLYFQTEVVTPAEPNLIIENITFTPTSVNAGESFDISYRITNIGDGDATVPTVARMRLSADDVLTLGDYGLQPLDADIPAIAAGGYHDVNLTVTVPSTVPAGDYYVGVFADALDELTQPTADDAGLSVLTLSINSTGSGVDNVGSDLSLRLPFPNGEAFIVTQGFTSHGAIDFGMPIGTPILATAAGAVVDVHDYAGTCRDRNGACGLDGRDQGGKWIKLRHEGESQTWYSSYLHLNSRHVNVGDQVSQGQLIGTSGDTGLSTGPHLHFQIRDAISSASNNYSPVPIAGNRVGGANTGIINSFELNQTYQAIEPDSDEIDNDTNYYHADSWLFQLSNYGAIYTGTNPTVSELAAEMHLLAIEYDVPIEVIAATAYQESGGMYQYGGDGWIVHNKGEDMALYNGTSTSPIPPGIGIMQLTGSTAQAYGIPRLIEDWRYNLEAGVQVLSQKFDHNAALDTNAGYGDIAQIGQHNRHVLENWYYPITLYNGGLNTSGANIHRGNIYSLIANPPSRLASIIGDFNITEPGEVISGWNYKNVFAAAADGNWHHQSGNVFQGPVHISANSPGDLDSDGDVDDTDLGTAIVNYTGPEGSGMGHAEGDIDRDGDVDDIDLGTLFANYTGPLSPLAQADASVGGTRAGAMQEQVAAGWYEQQQTSEANRLPAFSLFALDAIEDEEPGVFDRLYDLVLR